PRLLDSIEVARSAHPRGREAVEIIVADNASTDATAEIARSRGCRVVRVEKRAIAAARNGGAQAASGQAPCFVDSDGPIYPRPCGAMGQAVALIQVLGGATGGRMERWCPGIALTYALMMPMVWLTGFDTGVVFCRREDFQAVGGYDERRLVAEDVAFLVA